MSRWISARSAQRESIRPATPADVTVVLSDATVAGGLRVLPHETGRLLDRFVRVGFLGRPAPGDLASVTPQGIEYVGRFAWRRRFHNGR